MAQLFSLGSIERMQPILAMGDIAGGAVCFGLAISDAVLLIAVGLLALSLWKRSLVVVVIACALVLLASYFGISMMLWGRAMLLPIPKEIADDLYELRLIHECRFLSGVWLLATLTAVFCFVRVIKKRKGARHAA